MSTGKCIRKQCVVPQVVANYTTSVWMGWKGARKRVAVAVKMQMRPVPQDDKKRSGCGFWLRLLALSSSPTHLAVSATNEERRAKSKRCPHLVLPLALLRSAGGQAGGVALP